LQRFLRDGHQTVLEDKHRLHYELKQFEHVGQVAFVFPRTCFWMASSEIKEQLKYQALELLVEQDGVAIYY